MATDSNGKDNRGRFTKGNPYGRKSKRKDAFAEISKHIKPGHLIESLVEMYEDANTSKHLRVKIAEMLMDRIYGKPTQRNENTNIELPRVIGYYPEDFGDDSADTENTAAD
jgi:hypothetical protein